MILDKFISIKIAKYNINHFSKFFDVKIGDEIVIDTKIHMQRGSNIKLNVKCELCNEKRYIKYQSYMDNKERNENFPIYTCDKCSHIKIKETNKKKYGVEYYSKLDEYTDKVKKTSIEKYGVDHYSKTKDYIERRSKTNLEKLGFTNPFIDKESIKKTFFEKYGHSILSHDIYYK